MSESNEGRSDDGEMCRVRAAGLGFASAGSMKRIALVAAFIALTPASSPAAPGKKVDPKVLEAFRRAAAARGCDAIPYKEDRRDCEVRSRWQDEVCGFFGCEKLKVVKKLVDTINELNDEIHTHEDAGKEDTSHIQSQ